MPIDRCPPTFDVIVGAGCVEMVPSPKKPAYGVLHILWSTPNIIYTTASVVPYESLKHGEDAD
jgi:hypothetical protein